MKVNKLIEVLSQCNDDNSIMIVQDGVRKKVTYVVAYDDDGIVDILTDVEQ